MTFPTPWNVDPEDGCLASEDEKQAGCLFYAQANNPNWLAEPAWVAAGSFAIRQQADGLVWRRSRRTSADVDSGTRRPGSVVRTNSLIRGNLGKTRSRIVC